CVSFFFSSRRRHTRSLRDWSSDVCSSDLVLVHVQRQIGVLNAQEQIKSQVQEELGERQREMFLREQLKAIRKELGEEGEVVEVEIGRASCRERVEIAVACV